MRRAIRRSWLESEGNEAVTVFRSSGATLLARLALRCLVAMALPFALAGARAQTIDELTMFRQGSDVVARVTFNVGVRLLRQSSVNAAQLQRIDFELVFADESVVKQVVEETRRARGIGSAPDLSVSYLPAPRDRVKQLTLQLARAAVIKARQGVGGRSIDFVFAGAATGLAPSEAPMAPAIDRRYAVTLQTVPTSAPDKMLPVPVQFQAYDVFSVDVVVDGVPSVQVNLGYFATEEQAQRVRAQALARFPDATVLDLFRRKDEVPKPATAIAPAAAASAVLPAPAAPVSPAIPLTAPPTPATAASSQPPPAPLPAPAEQPTPAPSVSAAAAAEPLSEVDRRAAELLDKARQALTAKDYETAIQLLNQLLLLPPNPASKDAQELIGLAWERAGDPARARVEYQLYLKLFAEGEGAERVRQRLASMEGAAVPSPAAPAGATAAAAATVAPPPKTYTGSIAQYYYGGVARSQSLVNLTPGVDQETLTKTTQSALVTSVDMNARYLHPESETRVVVRGTGSTNLSTASKNTSQLGSAYVDYRRTESGLGVRAGRQSAINGGLIGFFDGVSIVYPTRNGLKVDVMGGVPANALVSSPSQRLFAAMLEADALFDQWGGNLYFTDQTSEGITNRRAVGAELRYSGERYSMYSLLDYDVNFKMLNAVSLQGSFQAPGQTTITVLLDSRKAPSLQLTNALISAGQTSLKTLLETQSMAQVREAALATTADARQGLISVSRPLNERWQMGVDLRYSQIGALPAVGNFEATPATGAQWGMTGQLTGSNLYSPRDISAFSASVMNTPQYTGAQISYNNLTGLNGNDLTLEPSIRLYSQHSSDGLSLLRVTPGMRVSYRVSRRASLLGESIVERSTTDGPTGHDTTSSVFFYLGYRYEFY